MREPDADGPLRRVRRALRPRDARARRARSWRRRSARRGPIPAFRDELDDVLRDYAGRPSILTECHNLGGRARRARAAQARGPQPHRLAQDQQRARPGAAGQADGQDPARRRDRRRPARRRHRHRGGAARAWSARSTWAPSTSSARRSTCSACACSAPRSRPCDSGSRTLKDAVNEALRDWVATVGDTHYCLGSVMGPHPYPWMVRELHRVDRRRGPRAVPGADRRRPRRRRRLRRRRLQRGRASSPGSSTPTARLVGVEPAGGAAVGRGVPGVVHGMRSYLMQDEHGQVEEAHSISAGLDYPGVGPEHSYLASIGRAEYPPVTDAEVLDAFTLLARTEGIISALRVGPRASPGSSARRRRPGRARPCSCTCPAAATRTSPRRWTCSAIGAADALTSGTMEAALPGRARPTAASCSCPTSPAATRAGRTPCGPPPPPAPTAIEIGIPFSDPVMDGPVIQQASQAALDAGRHAAGRSSTPPPSSTSASRWP